MASSSLQEIPARRLIAVHAHPDDESITTGGLLARCAGGGIKTCLVTCSDGRYGPVNPELGVSLSPDELAEVRGQELAEAAKTLGISELVALGYHDSGMFGSDCNHRPHAFWAQPVQQLVEQLMAVLRRFRPHVLVTYDAFGCTGHPDHIQAHRAAMLAVEAAADPRLFPERGPVWETGAVLYPVFPVSAMTRFIDKELAAGRPHPMAGKSVEEINYLRPDGLVTHRVEISAQYMVKSQALGAHRTQVGPHYPQMYRAALARRDHEHFHLAWNRGGFDGFGDVFEAVGA